MSKRRFRIPWHADLPCSEYDIPAIEAWLEDQARHGRLLKSWRYFTDCEPRECRYCLEPARKGEYKPSEDRRAAYADAGWELVCYTNGDTFSVWRSTRPDALPLRTDPAADSYAYEYLWKRYRLRLAASAAALGLLALLWAGSIFYGGMPVRNLLANPVQVWQLLAATCLLLGLLATAAADTRMLRRLLTALKTGIPMPSRAPSRRRLLLNRTFRWTGTAVNVLILLFLFLWAGVNNTSRPLSELPDAPTCLTALSLWENPADVAVGAIPPPWAARSGRPAAGAMTVCGTRRPQTLSRAWCGRSGNGSWSTTRPACPSWQNPWRGSWPGPTSPRRPASRRSRWRRRTLTRPIICWTKTASSTWRPAGTAKRCTSALPAGRTCGENCQQLPPPWAARDRRRL